MANEQEEYLRHLAQAGLLDEYKAIIALVEKGMALEDREPEKAVPFYRQAYDRVEAAGAVAGAQEHPLSRTRASILELVGELSRRGVQI